MDAHFKIVTLLANALLNFYMQHQVMIEYKYLEKTLKSKTFLKNCQLTYQVHT